MAALEPIEERYRRDWLELKDDRKVRGLDQQSPETAERLERLYVDPDTLMSHVARGDNINGSGNTLDLPNGPEIDPDNDNALPAGTRAPVADQPEPVEDAAP
jgi:hypothetical protein